MEEMLVAIFLILLVVLLPTLIYCVVIRDMRKDMLERYRVIEKEWWGNNIIDYDKLEKKLEKEIK